MLLFAVLYTIIFIFQFQFQYDFFVMDLTNFVGKLHDILQRILRMFIIYI